MNDYIILDIFWDHQIVREQSGKEFKIFRGIDYQTDWKKLGYGYSKDKKQIYYYNTEYFKKYYKEIDFETFHIVERHAEKNPYSVGGEYKETIYFADKNNVYVNSYLCPFSIIEGISPKDLKLIDISKGYATDGANDYVFDQKLPYKIKNTKPINAVYLIANDIIYFGNTSPLECDAKSFELVHEAVLNIAKDKNHVFYKDQIIEGADPKTFQFLDACILPNKEYYQECDIDFYAKDSKQAYFISTPFMTKIIKTKSLHNFRFEVIDGRGYAFDDIYRYDRGKRKKI
ncbi:DKNYY domain-containing protein [uncultured Aquimarina sp.]|uniref:DKNYY domain-containing protein n=1 Tax=uncultured Aquimarina sp. TaxID=575652 RepID=UPI002613FDB3|nr:DKNYY domain-containing protein [uncultured Aquimarina sp.]